MLFRSVGQGDEVPTAPVTVAVSLADKLDTLLGFWLIGERPTGTRDPFALRRAGIASLAIILTNNLRFAFRTVPLLNLNPTTARIIVKDYYLHAEAAVKEHRMTPGSVKAINVDGPDDQLMEAVKFFWATDGYLAEPVRAFLADRLKVQQREAGVRHDLIDAVFALGGEDDLVR